MRTGGNHGGELNLHSLALTVISIFDKIMEDEIRFVEALDAAQVSIGSITALFLIEK